MARCLIVGCGCRGRALSAELVGRGHAVRGTTRDPGSVELIAAAGAEPFIGDPARVGTLAPALEHVTVACLLMGSARGSEQELRALHGTRLEMLLVRVLDTTVRGLVYEARGSVGEELLADGARRVRTACEGSRIPFALIEADPADPVLWSSAAAAAVDEVLK